MRNSRRPPMAQDQRRRDRMAPSGRMWSESPIYGDWKRTRGEDVPRASCGNFNTYIPQNNGTIPALGLHDTTGMVIARSPYFKWALNGMGSGVLGDGDEQDLGVVFDPKGDFNYEQADWLAPGEPWEGYLYSVRQSGVTKELFGANDYYPDYADAKVWVLDTDYHYVTLYGAASIGWVVCQYLNRGPQICIHMLYYNGTGKEARVKMARGTDPDPDVYIGGDYDDYAWRGYGSESANDNIASYSVDSRYLIQMTNYQDYYPHNSARISDWPLDDYSQIDYILGGALDGGNAYLDYGIALAWDFGTVLDDGWVETSFTYSIEKLSGYGALSP